MENKKQMCAELESNCTENNERLLELMKTYELAKLGNEVQKQAFNDIYNEVLAKNEFYCNKGDFERVGVKKGDRITDEGNRGQVHRLRNQGVVQGSKTEN